MRKESKKRTIQIDQLADPLGQKHDNIAIDIYMEAFLAHRGLIEELEESGVLPVVENPNPYDPNEQLDEHDRWWKEHPKEATTFCEAIEHRQHILRHIYLGTKLK